MNIIICGAGRVGFTIAKLLTEQNHSVTVIDQSSEDIQKINETLDVKAIVGKATYPSILEKANASDADMIIAVTRNDEINMLICQIAFTAFKIPKKRLRKISQVDPRSCKKEGGFLIRGGFLQTMPLIILVFLQISVESFTFALLKVLLFFLQFFSYCKNCRIFKITTEKL